MSASIKVWVFSGLLVGCGGVVQEDGLAGGRDDVDDVDTLGAALGSTDPDCTNETASHEFDNYFPNNSPPQTEAWVTPYDAYPATQCVSAYLVNVSNPSALGAGWYNVIGPSNMPASAGECARWRAGAETWNKYEDGSYNFVGASWKWGVWSGGVCVLRVDVPWVTGYPQLRVGATVRRHATAGDIGSSYSTKKIKFQRLMH